MKSYRKKEVAEFTPKKLRNFLSYIEKRISEGVTNSRKLHKELKYQGCKASYTTVYRYILSSRIEKSKDFITYKPSRRFETGCGEQAQVDWGSFGKIEVNGKAERLYCFVYILGYSRILFAEFVVRQNLQTLQNCHIHAFEKLGIPQEIVYDNMKTVVLKREKVPKKIIQLNPGFLDFAKYYGFKIKLCSPYWPRAKGKVEASVKYIRNNFMQGLEFGRNFNSLNDINVKVQRWLNEDANIRIHRTTRDKPCDRWLKEKKYLRFSNTIPQYTLSPFVSRYTTRDGLIQYKSSFYSVPIKYARKKLLIKEANDNGITYIEVFYQDDFIAKHLLSSEKGKWIINDKHLKTESTHINKFDSKRIKRNIKNSYSSIGIRPLSYYDKFILKTNG